MLLGNRFFPLTGTPISNIEFRRIRLDDWDPVPLAVATLITKSFIDTSISGIHILASVISSASEQSLMHEGLEYSYLINGSSTRKIPIPTSVIFSFQSPPGKSCPLPP